MQRSAQKRNVSADRLSAGESAYGLINDRLEDRSRDVASFRAVVKQRLNVAFRENAAAGGYRVNGGVLFGELVEPLYVRVEQRRHLVDERARAARAASVHALLQTAREICNLRVLTA